MDSPSASGHPVGSFYDTKTDTFREVYGGAVQVFQLRTDDHSLKRQLELLDIRDGDVLLDAGCGLCGPALFFAAQQPCTIHALTLSEKQLATAEKHIHAHPAGDRVKLYRHNFLDAERLLGANSLDTAYFIESFNHVKAHDKAAMLDTLFRMLRPGGKVFIQDFFLTDIPNPYEWLITRIYQRRSAKDAHYYIDELYSVLAMAERAGFRIGYLNEIEVTQAHFDELQAPEAWASVLRYRDKPFHYIFEVYEIVLLKP